MENKIITRDHERLSDDQSSSMRFLYKTVLGRCLLKLLVHPVVSKIAGLFLNTRMSCFLIDSFIRKNHIDMKEYKKDKFSCYNDFFTREIKEECRPIDRENKHLISPSDSKITYYPIDGNECFKIKESMYTVNDLLQDPFLATQYQGGMALVFRLSVDDYHRYCFIDEGEVKSEYTINGRLHTVNPLASYFYKIYKTNTRHVTVMDTTHFDQVVMLEVGAMMVGKIKNLDVKTFNRGQIKGWFEFGGSTVVLLFKKDRVQIDKDIVAYSKQDIEVKIKMGEKIGIAIGKEG